MIVAIHQNTDHGDLGYAGSASTALLVNAFRRAGFDILIQSEDSAEGDQSFRKEADHGSGRKPIRRRSEATLALRCCQN